MAAGLVSFRILAGPCMGVCHDYSCAAGHACKVVHASAPLLGPVLSFISETLPTSSQSGCQGDGDHAATSDCPPTSCLPAGGRMCKLKHTRMQTRTAGWN